jgi:hypothetical protein
MAELIPQRPITTTEAPRTNLSAGQIAGPYSQLSDALEKGGEATEKAAESLAEQAGYNAVTRDENGNVQIASAPIIGPAAKFYDHAMKIAAVTEGEGEARRKDIEMRQQFRDRPDLYLKAADEFTKGIEDQYTQAGGKEVGLAMRRVIEPITTQTYKGLLNEKERLDLQRASAKIDAGVEESKNDLYAMANGGVTSGRDWDNAMDKYLSLSHSRVANPRLAYPQEKADQDLSEFKSELKARTIDYHLSEVQKNDGYEAAMKAARTNVLENRELNLPPAMRDAYYHRAVASINERKRADDVTERGVAMQVESAARMALKGFPPNAENLGFLRSAVAQTRNPELADKQDKTELVAADLVQVRKMSPFQLEQANADLERTMREKGGSPDAEAVWEARQGFLKEMRKGIAEDQLGWANRTGTVQIPPIQFGTPDATGQMTDRAARAEVVAQHYGTKPVYLQPNEREALGAAVAKGGADMVNVSRALVEGFGDRAPKVMEELSHSAPALAHVGALMQSGGNPGFAMDVAEAAQMRADKEFKLPQWMNKPSDQILAAQSARTRDVYGSAYALLPDGGRAAQQAAQDAFFTRAVRHGYDPALGEGRALPGVAGSGPSTKAYDQALQESAGAKFIEGTQYGGVATYSSKGMFPWSGSNKVAVPGNIRADKFPDVIRAITDDDLQRKIGVSPQGGVRDIQAATPIRVKGGYAFAQGDPTSDNPKFIQNVMGKPFVLNLDSLEPDLRKRVPGAFLGGR